MMPMGELAELAAFLKEAKAGPWEPEPDGAEWRDGPNDVWLTNAAGDSLLVSAEAVAALLNAALRWHRATARASDSTHVHRRETWDIDDNGQKRRIVVCPDHRPPVVLDP